MNLDSGGKGTLLWDFPVRCPEWIRRSTSPPPAPGSRFIPHPPNPPSRPNFFQESWEMSYLAGPALVYTGCNQSEVGALGPLLRKPRQAGRS